jgi:hypothetical protein
MPRFLEGAEPPVFSPKQIPWLMNKVLAGIYV